MEAGVSLSSHAFPGFRCAASGYGTDWLENNSNPGDVNWPQYAISSIADVIFDGPFGSHLKHLTTPHREIESFDLENIGHLNFFETKRTYIAPEKFNSLLRHGTQTR